MKNRWFVGLTLGALLFACTSCASPARGRKADEKRKAKKAKASEVDRDYVPRGGFR